MRLILCAATAAIAFFTACKKDPASLYNKQAKAELIVEFDNIAGSSNLELATATYTNAAGEPFTVETLKYYVSNFVLTNADGTVYTVPQDSSYFLIDESKAASQEVTLHVPEGAYTTLTFILGVDSLRSTMDIAARTGVLDPTASAGEMYWTWNSGYIFFKMEGQSPASPNGAFMYHIGGFGGYDTPGINNIKTVSIDLVPRGVAQVKQGRHAAIHLMTDVTKLFDGEATVSIAANPLVMFSEYSATIATNFTGMFRHDHTHND